MPPIIGPNVSRKLITNDNGDHYIVEGCPGSYRLLKVTTVVVGEFKRSWQAVEAAHNT